MFRIFRISTCSLIILVFLSSFALAAEPDNGGKSTQQAIDYLVEAVLSSHLTFVRNGKEYSSDEAARHMMDKYGYFKSRIKTPEDFIRLCASKSLLSGKPYLVETAQGTVPTKEWFARILAEYRKDQRSRSLSEEHRKTPIYGASRYLWIKDR